MADRSRGAHLGLAAADALGRTLEVQAAGTFAPITDLVDGGGPFRLQPGKAVMRDVSSDTPGREVESLCTGGPIAAGAGSF